jgi:hypothetical protein
MGFVGGCEQIHTGSEASWCKKRTFPCITIPLDTLDETKTSLGVCCDSSTPARPFNLCANDGACN